MRIVTIHEAKTHLSRLVREAVAGEENRPGRRASGQAGPHRRGEARRVMGTAKGLIELADDFDEPLADFDDYR